MWGFLNKVGEVLAPSVHSPLDDFKNHWMAVRSFYIDEKDDVEEGQIPQHLSSMLQMILEEETQDETQGICLDFFFRNRILEFICAFGMRDRPEGMRKYTLTIVTQLLRNCKFPLLGQMSIHEPLSKLILTCWEDERDRLQRNKEEEEFIGLVSTTVQRLTTQPEVLPFFMDGLIEEVDEKKGYDVSKGRKFPPFDILKNYIGSCGPVGERSRNAIVAVVSLDSYDVDKYILEASDLTSDAVKVLTSAFEGYMSWVEVKDGLKSEAKHEQEEWAISIMKFFDGISLRKENMVSFALCNVVRENVLETAVRAGLMSKNADIINQTTRFMTDFVRTTSSELLQDTIAQFLLGSWTTNTQTVLQPPPDNEALQRALCDRINSDNAEMSECALGLWNAVVSAYNRSAICGLVLNNIRRMTIGVGSRNAFDSADVQKSISSFMELSPSSTLSSASGYDAYLADAQTEVSTARRHCSAWLPITTDSVEQIHANDGPQFEGYFLNALFRRLEAMPDHPFENNLLITSIFTTLCRYPREDMQSYFLDPTLKLIDGTSSLYGSLRKVSGSVVAQLNLVEQFPNKLELVRSHLFADTEMQTPGIDAATHKVLCAAVLLEEFVKELAASLQASAVMSIVADSSAIH